MEERRRWEEMDMDCLVNIFQRLGLEDLTLGVPFLCKSWYRASLDPLCWRVLDLEPLDFMPWSKFTKRFMTQYSLHHFSFSGFMKLVAMRSRGSAIELRFPPVFGASMHDLFHASSEWPGLKKVVLPNLLMEDEVHIPELVAKWKELELLEMQSKPASFSEMVTEISRNCKNFAGLRMFGSIKKDDVLAIVRLLPKLKHLCFDKSYLPKEQLLMIMDGCKELEKLSVKDCIGFEADEEVMRKTSGIKIFESEGSKLFDDSGYDTDECDPLYVHVI
ncbi:F-box/LRR-repeat protein At3g48880-like isoform X2 [Phoenix dactylifera]|uniref:F-box/LRR-repeat protein At3g48880-like isoform X2 n=1 Tax=Phoenix dactylifera TaxID=42345 RepID=A0A8B8Z8L5_PHODC|nr:F-box/LRR-repeat protein At3g48880-like isoform X2 [Phoenix dactylifera]